MRLYHWTRAEDVVSIQLNGWRNSTYQAEPPMELGVWFSESPDSHWAVGNTALLAVDIDDRQLRPEWRSRLIDTDWQIPNDALSGLPAIVLR